MDGTQASNNSVEQVVVYLRISEDRTGAEAGVERQREDCLEMCARLGITDPAIFMDNDISAYSGKKRPSYLDLLERVKLGPSRIVAWHVDRLYRRPRELEDLIDLVETHPIRIETVKGGAFDLNTHEGRLMARQLVAIASYESGHKADRIRRANQQKAERGDWHGGAKYGYGIGGVLIPEEAAVIREMADRFLAGQSVRQITRWLNRDDGPVPPSKGKSRLNVWHESTVGSILCSARISGQRAYEPASKTTTTWERRDRAILGPGNWEAIITPEETARIRAVFNHPDRRVGRSSKSLLAGLITCAKCGNTLVSSGLHRGETYIGKRRFYRCLPLPGRPERGGLVVSAHGIETLVGEAMITRLAATTLPTTGPSEDAGVSAAMEQITAARQRMEDMARDYGAGLLSRTELHAAKTAATATITSAELMLGRSAKSSALKGIPIGDAEALRAAWDEEWSIPQKRAIIAALIDTLIVKPAQPGKTGARFRPERVELTFKA